MISTIAVKAILSFVRHGVHMEFWSDGYTTTARRLAFGRVGLSALSKGAFMAMLLVSFLSP
jgi:hypothetical protein